jgi:LmbE family N-acetylglucosaminyl deacetylase
MFDPKKILVLAPHTDDGELGCGGSIAKFCSEGKQVYYVAFSLCSKSLSQELPADTLVHECKKAVSILGIAAENVTLFDYEVRNFPAKRQELLEELLKLKRAIAPDLVFIPSSADIHQDHEVIHAEALRAFRNISLLGYELPWNQIQFRLNFFIKLTDENINRKAEALKAYESQSHRNYMQNDFIFSLAKVRGVQCNAEHAEVFEVYRLVS